MSIHLKRTHSYGLDLLPEFTDGWVVIQQSGSKSDVWRLAPGEDIQYTSAAVLTTPVGTMHGSYQMVADDGNEFDAPIPAFGLSVPNVLH